MEYSIYTKVLNKIYHELASTEKAIVNLKIGIHNSSVREKEDASNGAFPKNDLFSEFFNDTYSENVEEDKKTIAELEDYMDELSARLEILKEDTKVEFTILDKITNLAKSKNLTISAVEKGAGLKNGTIRRWNTSYPSIEKLVKVADYFEVTLDYLINRDISGDTILIDDVLSRKNTVTVKFRDDSDMKYSEADEVELTDSAKKVLLALARSVTFNDEKVLQQDFDLYEGKIDANLNPINKED